MNDIVRHAIDSRMQDHLHDAHERYVTAATKGDSDAMAEISLHLAEVYGAFGHIVLSVRWAEEYARCSGNPIFYPYWKKDPALLN